MDGWLADKGRERITDKAVEREDSTVVNSAVGVFTLPEIYSIQEVD